MSDAKPGTICYCFNYTKSDIEADLHANGRSTLLERILAAKKVAGCRCEELNPSGG